MAAPMNTYDPTHPHEPDVPPVIAPDGHCRICRLMVERDDAQAEANRLRGLLNEAHLTRIAVENPGIDIERVRAERGW